MELLDGHLHVHLDLGSGSVKIRASRVPLNDGRWHQVELTIKKQIGRITIDGETEAFETPGKGQGSRTKSFLHSYRLYVSSY